MTRMVSICICWTKEIAFGLQITDACGISRYFPTAGLLRSLGILPCDFCLWSCLNHTIYHRRPAPVPDLKDSIRSHVLGIPADSIRSDVENMVFELEHIVHNEGRHIEWFKWYIINIYMSNHIQYLYVCSSAVYRRIFVLKKINEWQAHHFYYL